MMKIALTFKNVKSNPVISPVKSKNCTGFHILTGHTQVNSIKTCTEV